MEDIFDYLTNFKELIIDLVSNAGKQGKKQVNYSKYRSGQTMEEFSTTS